MKPEKILYTATATATGGRTGTVKSSDGVLEVNLSTPKELGGAGGPGTNPEQLFAAGYSACFIGAIKAVASGQTAARRSRCPGGFDHERRRHRPDPGGFGIQVAMKISLPGMERAAAEALVAAAHKVCPYSNATRGNIDVTLTLV